MAKNGNESQREENRLDRFQNQREGIRSSRFPALREIYYGKDGRKKNGLDPSIKKKVKNARSFCKTRDGS